MFKLLLCRNPAKAKSSAPVTPAQLSLPGSARALAITSENAATLSVAGTDMVIKVFDTLTMGSKSAGL